MYVVCIDKIMNKNTMYVVKSSKIIWCVSVYIYYTTEKVEITIMYVVLIRKIVVYISVYVVVINTKCYKSMLYINK